MPRWFGALAFGMLAFGCGSPPPPSPYEPATEIGDMMAWLLEPAADAVWDSAGEIITAEGVEDLAPANDAEWEQVRNQGALISELGNLLLMPHFAQERADWMEISRGLVKAGARVRQAAEARDAEALFNEGGLLYQVCVSCHQIYWNTSRFDDS